MTAARRPKHRSRRKGLAVPEPAPHTAAFPAPTFVAQVLASDRLLVWSLPPIVCLTFLAGLGNGLVGDDWILLKWCRLRGVASVLEAFDPSHDFWYYRPLLKLLFGATHALFGIAPLPYHLLSLGAHTAVVVLLYRVVRCAGGDVLVSFLSALLFGVHLHHHEGLFWFSAVSYPLSTSLGLASMLLFRSYLGHRRFRSLAGATLALAASLLTKDSSASFALLVPLYGFLFAESADSPPDLRRDWPSLVPIALVLAAVVALNAVPVNGGQLLARGGTSFQHKGLRDALTWARDAVVIWTPGLDAIPAGTVRNVLAAMAGGLLAGFALLGRSRIALAGAALALISNLPFFFFVPQTGDLYQYIPLIGVCVVAAEAARRALGRPREGRTRDGSFAVRPATAAVLLVLALFLVYSIGRIQVMAARWRAAGEAVSGVLQAVAEAEPALRTEAERTIAMQGLPLEINGIYTFLNADPSAFEVFFQNPSLHVVSLAPGVQGFLWDDWRFFRVDRDGRRTLLRSFTGLQLRPAGDVP